MSLLKENKAAVRLFHSPALFINPRVKEAGWQAMKGYMEQIIQLSRSRGIPLGVVIYPYSSQIALKDLERKPQIDLMEFLNATNVPVLDAVTIYQDAKHAMFVDRFLHLSPYGHRRIAAAIHDFVSVSGFLP